MLVLPASSPPRAALGIELDHARFHDDPPRPEPRGGIPLPCGAVLGEGQLGAPTAGVEPPASLPGRTGPARGEHVNHQRNLRPSGGNLEGDSAATCGLESASWRRAAGLAMAWKWRSCRCRTLSAPSACVLKTNGELPVAPAGAPRRILVWCRAEVKNSTCRQTLASHVSSKRQFALILPSVGRVPSAPVPHRQT
jgi:hypothetical protein